MKGEYSGATAETSIIETTVGDLVEIVTQLALESGKSKSEGYYLASLVLENMLAKNKHLLIM